MIRAIAAALALLGASAGALHLASEAGAATGGGAGSSTGGKIAVEAPKRAPPRQIDLPRGDPFRPFDQPAPSIGATPAPSSRGREKLKYMGTIARGVAMINGELYRAGDKIDGATIKSIDSERVILERDGVPEVLTIEEN